MLNCAVSSQAIQFVPPARGAPAKRVRGSDSGGRAPLSLRDTSPSQGEEITSFGQVRCDSVAVVMSGDDAIRLQFCELFGLDPKIVTQDFGRVLPKQRRSRHCHG